MITHTFAICAYQDSPYLEACIRSLKRQTVSANIILCTSTPSVYIEELAQQYGLPCYVREGESDIQEDWNFAYHMADSKLVTIAHQDDMYHKSYAQIVQLCWNYYPDVTVMSTDARIVKDNQFQKPGQVELMKKLLRFPLRFSRWNNLDWVKESVLQFGNPIVCPSCTYQKELLGEPVFQSKYKFALDWDTMARLASKPGRFLCVEKPLLYYRIHEEATTKSCILDHSREQEELEMFQRFWPGGIAKLLMQGYKKAYSSYD